MDGTTEILRTTIFGDRTPSALQKEAYTRVLRATIDVERIVWKANTRMTSRKMEILSYKNLKNGLNF